MSCTQLADRPAAVLAEYQMPPLVLVGTRKPPPTSTPSAPNTSAGATVMSLGQVMLPPILVAVSLPSPTLPTVEMSSMRWTESPSRPNDDTNRASSPPWEMTSAKPAWLRLRVPRDLTGMEALVRGVLAP